MRRDHGLALAAAALLGCVWILAACGGEPSAPAEEPAAPAVAPPAPAPAPPRAAAPPAPSGSQVDPSRVELRYEAVEGKPIPDAYPDDLPAPEGAAQVAAYDGGEAVSIVVWEAQDPPGVVADALGSQYEGAGWQVNSLAEGEEVVIFALKGEHVSMTRVTLEGEKTRIETTVKQALVPGGDPGS